jgi:hypothetical protein
MCRRTIQNMSGDRQTMVTTLRSTIQDLDSASGRGSTLVDSSADWDGAAGVGGRIGSAVQFS